MRPNISRNARDRTAAFFKVHRLQWLQARPHRQSPCQQHFVQSAALVVTLCASAVQVLSVLAELFCFTYIGSSISIDTSAWQHGVTWATLVSFAHRCTAPIEHAPKMHQ